MGIGKTLITSNLIRYKMNSHHEVLRTLIFCPIIVLENWKRELLMSTQLKPDCIGVVIGSKNKRLNILKNPGYKVLIINYEATRSPEILDLLTRFAPKIVVCDESHTIKSRTSKIYKAVKQISKPALYKYALSGTPMTNSAEDYWSQFMFLDDGETFGSKFYSFKGRYFVNKNANWKGSQSFPSWEFNSSLEGEFKEKLHTKSVFMKIEGAIELPELVEQTIEVKMIGEQEKHYKQIKRDLITWVENQEDNPLVVKNALTKMLRLNEILSGYMKLEDETIFKLKSNPKLDALMHLIESSAPHKVNVFSVFRQNYADISKALEKRGIKYVEIHGGVSNKQKLENVDIFNDMDNDVRVCILNPASGGVGVNLKAAKYRVFYTRGYSMKDYYQACARNLRGGSIEIHDKIIHYDLIMKDTIDELILDSIKNKNNFANSLMSIKKILGV